MLATTLAVITLFTLSLIALLAIKIPSSQPVVFAILAWLALLSFLAMVAALGLIIEVPAILPTTK